jgi:hypothetical protein
LPQYPVSFFFKFYWCNVDRLEKVVTLKDF